MTDDEVLEGARRGDPVALTRALVAVPSVNPDLEDGGQGEEEVGRVCADWLDEWGYEARVVEIRPGRVNVVAHGGKGSPRLLLNGHLDTVGVEGMTVPPFDAGVRDGRIWGRGACDMKAGIGAILAVARELAREEHPGSVVVALTADEEHRSVGMQALVRDGTEADAAVVCEPTELAVMPAHRGFVWIELRFRGRAAHGSRPDLGVDAIRHAGLFLAELDRYEARLADRPPHPLLTPPSVHGGTIEGGTAPPIYPEECRLVLERRTLPGETSDDVEQEIREVVRTLERSIPQLDVEVVTGLSRRGTEVPSDDPLVRSLLKACEDEGLDPRLGGMSAWVDAGLLNQAGVPAVCFGPGSIAQAHAAEEWVRIDEVEVCTRTLLRFARQFLGGGAEE